MSDPRDILDEFDDDALRSSIEKAEKGGQWRDPGQTFVDPKLEALRKQLSEPARESYSTRRLRELQRYTTAPANKKEPAKDAAAKEQEALESAFAEDMGGPLADGWRPRGKAPSFDEVAAELSGPQAAAAATPTPAAPAPTEPEIVRATAAGSKPAPTAPGAPSTPASVPAEPVKIIAARPPSGNPVVEQLRLVVPGLCVFAPVALLQLMLAGWRYDLLLRIPIASALAGIAWHKVDADRIRGGAIGGGVHLLTFFLTSFAWSTRDVMANVFGLLAALIGSGLVGWVREMYDEPLGGRR